MPLSSIFGGFKTLKKHFFLSQRTKGKNKEKVEKIEISVEIFIDLHQKSIFHQYFDRNIGNFVPCIEEVLGLSPG